MAHGVHSPMRSMPALTIPARSVAAHRVLVPVDAVFDWDGHARRAVRDRSTEQDADGYVRPDDEQRQRPRRRPPARRVRGMAPISRSPVGVRHIPPMVSTPVGGSRKPMTAPTISPPRCPVQLMPGTTNVKTSRKTR